MATNLFSDLASGGWHSSIVTTYSVDPSFYDGSIEYRLRTYGCENNLLMADASMLKRALNATPEAFRNAGRKYAVVPVKMDGCFHPKIHLRLGRDRSRLVVGSANATAAGWGSNQEIVTIIDWDRRSEDQDVAPLGSLIRKAYDYLDGWLSAVPGDAVEYKRRLHFRDSPYLADLEANSAPIELADGSTIDLFCERSDGQPGMMSQLVQAVGNEDVERLVVVSPYWDADLSGLSELLGELDACPTSICLNPEFNEFPVAAVDQAWTIEFIPLVDADLSQRFLHAKVILVETKSADHVLFGSANCSDDALGGMAKSANNAEVSVYRRLARGSIRKMLGIDLSKTIPAETIRQPNDERSQFESGRNALPAGQLELQGQRIYWFPLGSIDGTGAALQVQGEAIAFLSVGNGQFACPISDDLRLPMVARIRLADGRITDPILIHDDAALRRASPGLTDRRLRNAFDRVRNGEEDIIDLALQAHLIFERQDGATARQGRAGKAGRKRRSDNGTDHATAEDFRNHVQLTPASGTSGRFTTDHPGLLELLRIIFKGVADVGNLDLETQADIEETQSLEDAEVEDGDENNEEAPNTDDLPPSITPPAPPPAELGVYSPNAITRRRNQLQKSLSAFEDLLSHYAEHPNQVTGRLPAQTAFVLDLMLYACTKEHQTEEGSVIFLMDFAPSSVTPQQKSFAVRAAKMLKAIWLGAGRKPPLVNHIQLDTRFDTIPDDIVYLVIMTRWAITRAYLAVADLKAKQSLSDILQTAAVQIFRATTLFGPINTEAEQDVLTKLDGSLGFPEADTAKLVASWRDFMRQLSIDDTSAGKAQ